MNDTEICTSIVEKKKNCRKQNFEDKANMQLDKKNTQQSNLKA